MDEPYFLTIDTSGDYSYNIDVSSDENSGKYNDYNTFYGYCMDNCDSSECLSECTYFAVMPAASFSFYSNDEFIKS